MPSWLRLAEGSPWTVFQKSLAYQVPKHFGDLVMRSLIGGGRSQKTTSGGCVSAIQMCQDRVNRVRWGAFWSVTRELVLL